MVEKTFPNFEKIKIINVESVADVFPSATLICIVQKAIRIRFSS